MKTVRERPSSNFNRLGLVLEKKKGKEMIGKENLTGSNTFNAYSCKVCMHRICLVTQSAKGNMLMDDR